jgi:hypothetical protein
VEAYAALIGAYRAVHLDAYAAVDLHLTGIVDPGDAEHDHALGLGHALQNFRLNVLGILIQKGGEGVGHLFRRLVKLGFGGVSGFEMLHES